MAMILTTHGEMDESALQKREDVRETDNERTTSVEYCLADCEGAAHRTGVPDAPPVFCTQHVHRSAHVTLKRWPHGLGGVFGSFT